MVAAGLRFLKGDEARGNPSAPQSSVHPRIRRHAYPIHLHSLQQRGHPLTHRLAVSRPPARHRHRQKSPSRDDALADEVPPEGTKRGRGDQCPIEREHCSALHMFNVRTVHSMCKADRTASGSIRQLFTHRQHSPEICLKPPCQRRQRQRFRWIGLAPSSQQLLHLPVPSVR